MLTNILLFVGGLIVLVVGAEWLVRGASRLAALLGVSPLVIGLTIVAFGTSSPELAVSVQTALRGQADISIGNVIGSNVFNVLFILGVAALIRPILIAEQLIRLDVPIMIAVSVFTYFLAAMGGSLSQLDGVLLFGLLIAYIIFSLKQSKVEEQAVQDEYAEEYAVKEPKNWRTMAVNFILIGAGLTLLVFGSNWLVEAATSIARALGVSELVIGLTIVAAGTSMPEVATSIVAAIKGEGDISAGNVIGSNIFNMLGVLGLAGMVAPQDVVVSAQVLAFDLPVAIFAAVVVLPVFFVDNTISRFDGAILFSYFVAYTVFVVLRAMNSPASGPFNMFLALYIPLTFLLLVGLAIRHMIRRRRTA